MKVINRINNNVVLVLEGNQKMIVSGKGLGFKVYPGDIVKDSLIEQRYILQEDQSDDHLIELLRKIPFEVLHTSEQIVRFGSSHLGKTLPDSLVFTLADHINFSMDRMRKGLMIDHPLANEIKQFYPKEMEVGYQGLHFIKQLLECDMPNGEAVFITMHIVNAAGGLSNAYDVSELTEMMSQIVTYIEQRFQCTIQLNSTAFSRFITHLRYYLIRQLNFEIEESINDELLEIVKEKYPDAFACASAIATHLDQTYGSISADSEKLYLTLHINRLLNKT